MKPIQRRRERLRHKSRWGFGWETLSAAAAIFECVRLLF